MGLKAKSLIKLLASTSIIAIVVWVIGFIIFAATLPKLDQKAPTQIADGIIVLTGSDGRLQAGVQLLSDKKGARLLVSGVHHTVVPSDLRRITNAPEQLFDCCVDLDRASADTIDNAEVSADWTTENGYKTIYLVTADYHMRRSLLLLQNVLPDCEILPYPVTADISVQAFALEYTKFIITYASSALTA